METFTIGEVAKQAQVRIETLRYYERLGLVAPPPRNGSNYRLYPSETVQRVQFIKRAQQLGFSLKEIAELLELRTTPDTPCTNIRIHAVAKIDAIDTKIRALHAMKRALTQLVAECPGEGAVTNCPILVSLDDEKSLEELKG